MRAAALLLASALLPTGAWAAPWGACAADPAYVDPDAAGLVPAPAFAAPPPPEVTVPAPRLPLVLTRSERVWTPAQPLPTDLGAMTARVGCPHLAPGLRPWHDPALWPNGTVPEGGTVVLPANTSVLLSSCSLAPASIFDSITVPEGSALVFADADVTLRAYSVTVQGALRAGAPTCRLLSRVNITLYGARPGPDTAARIDALPHSTKTVMATGRGSIDLHGAQYAVTWSRLASRALRNDSWLFLQDAVNWEPGQSVIVVTTALKEARDYSESEERVIRSVYVLPGYANVTAVQLDQPLNFSHWSSTEYQGEVGLLSRRLSVQGWWGDSLPTDVQPTGRRCSDAWFSSIPCANHSLSGFGGQVMVMGPRAQGRFSGVLFRHGGGTNVMAHYPLHYHFVGNGTFATNATTGAVTELSYVQDSSFWTSFFRCVSVHSTHRLRLSNNVAHDITGHCMYLEDGVEERNIFEYNLVSQVHPIGGIPHEGQNTGQYLPDTQTSPGLIVPADIAAAGYYCSNPYNVWRGNVASGGWSGFIFPGMPGPTGLSRNVTGIVPQNRPLLVFDGNTAHSSGYWWGQAGCIYTGGNLFYPNASRVDPTYNPGRVSGRSGYMNFTNTKVFLCSVGFMHWGASLDIYGLEVHDVMRAGTVFGTVGIDNMLVDCRTQNMPTAPGTKSYERGFYNNGYTAFQFYDVGQSHILNNVTMRNCSDLSPTARAWQMLTHSDQFVPDMMQATQRISYENMAPANDTAASRYRIGVTVNGTSPSVSLRLQNWLDDGSVTGRGRPTILGSWRSNRWWQFDNNCSLRTDWSVWLCDALPGRFVASAFFNFDRVAQAAVGTSICSNGVAGVPCPDIGNVTHIGHGPRDGMPFSMNTKITGPSGGFGWFAVFYNGTPRVLNISAIQMRPADNVTLVLPYPQGTQFNVTARISSSTCPGTCTVARGCLCQWRFTEVGSPEAVRSGRGDTYHFTGQHLYLRLTPHSSSNIGVNGSWGISPSIRGFSRFGVELAPRTSHVIQITASCPTVDPAGLYCALPADLAYPTTPCATGVQTGIDTCGPASSTPTGSPTPSWSATPSPTPSRTPTASLSATQSPSAPGTPPPSLSAAATATPSATPPPTGTPSTSGSGSVSSTAQPTSSPSRSASTTGSVSGSPTGSVSVSGSPSRSVSVSGTGTATVSPPPTPSSSPPPSPSVSPSGSGTVAATGSASSTLSGTGSASRSVAPSSSPTETPPATPSESPAASETASITGSKTTAPSASASRSRTPAASRSATPSQSRSVTRSRPASPSLTPTKSVTKGAAASRTPSRTPTKGGGTPVAAVGTPSPSLTRSATRKPKRD